MIMAVVGMVLTACLAVKGGMHLLAEQQSLIERSHKVSAVPANTLPYLHDFLVFYPFSQTELLFIQTPGGAHDFAP